MDIAHLEAFERAAREGSITRAAASLGLSQPAVSMRITQLEAELGGAVFERGGRQLTLTPLGARFLPYAQRVLAVMADGLEEARSFRRGEQGQIKLAAPTPFILSFLVQTLTDFRDQHPRTDILIRERSKTTVLEMLDDNLITLGLVNAPVYDGHYRVLGRFQDAMRAVVAPGHPLAARRDDLRMADLYAHTIFRVSMFPQMTAFIDEVVEHGRSGSGGAVIAIPMVMALQLVTLGQGVTFLPESYIKPALESGQVVTLTLADMPPLVSEPVLIQHRDRQLDTLHQAFVRIFKGRWRHLLVG
jgi:DNA-binding transcriptional LysR family regulator